jgi:GNAT superfamily N-acetyltransferase
MTRQPRLAHIGDLPSLETIVRAAYTPYVARLGREPGPMSDDYAALIRDGHVHIIEDAGGVQAILVLIPEAGGMLLDNVAVHPRAQRLGIGRALLEFAEREARAVGFRTIRLYTNVAMTENIALYARIGYVETHRAEEKGLHRVYMTKALN